MEKMNYPTKEEMKSFIQEWVDNHSQEIIDNLVEQTPFNSFDELTNAERNCYYGLDCGFVSLIPKDRKMYKQWEKEDWYKLYLKLPFDCQSTTLQKKQMRYVVEQLGFNEMFYVDSVLD